MVCDSLCLTLLCGFPSTFLILWARTNECEECKPVKRNWQHPLCWKSDTLTDGCRETQTSVALSGARWPRPPSWINDGSLWLGDSHRRRPRGSSKRGAWRWKDKVQGKVRVLQFHPSPFVSHLYLLPLIPPCPAFHHFLVLSPLLLAPLPSLSWLEGFMQRWYLFSAVFPFQLFLHAQTEGHRTLNHR